MLQQPDNSTERTAPSRHVVIETLNGIGPTFGVTVQERYWCIPIRQRHSFIPVLARRLREQGRVRMGDRIILFDQGAETVKLQLQLSEDAETLRVDVRDADESGAPSDA